MLYFIGIILFVFGSLICSGVKKREQIGQYVMADGLINWIGVLLFISGIIVFIAAFFN